jgi:hypothetical protein
MLNSTAKFNEASINRSDVDPAISDEAISI